MFLVFGLYACAPAQAAVPTVVVSIKPFHALAAAVMEGVGRPTLLLSDGSSPHTYGRRQFVRMLNRDENLSEGVRLPFGIPFDRHKR